MDIEDRSLKYIEFHMFRTFAHIFLDQMQIEGYWHDSNGFPRYESIVQNLPNQKGLPISYLFPPFDPDCDQYDTYNFGEDDEEFDDEED